MDYYMLNFLIPVYFVAAGVKLWKIGVLWLRNKSSTCIEIVNFKNFKKTELL